MSRPRFPRYGTPAVGKREYFRVRKLLDPDGSVELKALKPDCALFFYQVKSFCAFRHLQKLLFHGEIPLGETGIPFWQDRAFMPSHPFLALFRVAVSLKTLVFHEHYHYRGRHDTWHLRLDAATCGRDTCGDITETWTTTGPLMSRRWSRDN
jgi:hypothetical protein